MTRMTTDVDALSSFLQTGLAQAVVSLLTVVGVAVALLRHRRRSWRSSRSPCCRCWSRRRSWFRVLSSRAYAEARERVAVVNADMQENVTGVRVAQAFTRERHSSAVFGDRSLAYRRSRLRAQRYIATFFPFVALLSDLATAAVLGVGAARVAAGALTPGVLTAFLLYLGLFFAPVQQLSQVFDGYQQARIGLRRIGDLLRTPTTVPDDGRPVRRAGPAARRGGAARRRLLLRRRGPARARRGVAARGAGGDGRAGRRDRRGQVDAGQAARPVLRRRTTGAVLVDGVDVRGYRLAGFRHRLGVVPQEAHLFTGDVASNIAYGRPDATPAEIEAAARAVGALALVRRLPRGLPHARRRARAGAVGGAAPARRAGPRRARRPRTCCSSTRPRPRSTRRPRPRSSRRVTGVTSAAAPRSSSRTGWRPRPARTASSCCTAGGSPSRARPPSCSRRAGDSPGCGRPASSNPPQTTRTATRMISME